MVQYYGMSSKVGALSFYDSTGARGYELVKPYSEKTAELMDQEVRNLVDEVHARTEKIIKDNYDAFEKVAKLLLDKEVIMQDDLEAILGPKVTDKEPEAEVEAEPKPTETENE